MLVPSEQGQDGPFAFAGVSTEHTKVEQARCLCLASFLCSVLLREQIFILEFLHVHGCKQRMG